MKWLSNDWSLNPVFQEQAGLPYSATIGTGYPSYSAYAASWNGAGTNYWIPALGRNTYQQPKTVVADLRLEKQLVFHAYDKPYHLQLVGEFFNLAIHQNATGVNTTAYNLSSNSSVTSGCTSGQRVTGQAQEECSTLTYQYNTGTTKPLLGTVTNANNNFAYSQREIQLSMRLDF